MFGISRCDMSKAAVKAMLVIPGVAAIRGNGGASLLRETFPSHRVASNADRARDLVAIFLHVRPVPLCCPGRTDQVGMN
jgi:hypothetical protein